MLEAELCVYAEKLAEVIRHKEFEPITQRTPYYHMGATITDAILQAGLNYQNVVYPRVRKLLTEFPDYKTTSDFLILMQVVQLPELIDWKKGCKLERVKELSWFLFSHNLENEDDLADWLRRDEHINQLRSISGVGPKTIDYLKMLSGAQAIAIDRHLFAFLEIAGIFNRTYEEARMIYSIASELLGISQYEIDKQVWHFMATTEK